MLVEEKIEHLLHCRAVSLGEISFLRCVRAHAPCHGNRDELRPDGPLGSYVYFTYAHTLMCARAIDAKIVRCRGTQSENAEESPWL